MVVDITDLLKYAWILLVAIIPKMLSIGNNKLKSLEARDKELNVNVADLSSKVAIIDLKLDSQAALMADLRRQIEDTNTILTEFRIKVGEDGR